jgi:hypothetical protein
MSFGSAQRECNAPLPGSIRRAAGKQYKKLHLKSREKGNNKGGNSENWVLDPFRQPTHPRLPGDFKDTWKVCWRSVGLLIDDLT